MDPLTLHKIIPDYFRKESHIAPLVVLRITFGAVMFYSTVRFFLKGWITEFYLRPEFHFTFYGLHWLKPLGAVAMCVVFATMALAALGIMSGFFYRISSITFFITFLYVELLDKTYYLNHYYLVSLIAFLLILVPANGYCSLDVKRNTSIFRTRVPRWTISIFKFQILLVYFFAGLSKLNHEWLFDAMPLKIWLPAQEHLPLIGHLLEQEWVAYLFAWSSAMFDLSIGFLLMNSRSRRFAYVFIAVFHISTAILFKIGMFPWIMMTATFVFFSEEFSIRLLRLIPGWPSGVHERPISRPGFVLTSTLILFFCFQIVLPLRFIAYPGNLLWTEEGYRFSWRVMLMEKAGTAFFTVQDGEGGTKMEIPNARFLTPFQEKMMATQPDMILEYGHFLADEFRAKGVADPVVKVQSYVTLNGSGSRLFINPEVDIAKQKEGFCTYEWILPRTSAMAAK